MNVAAGLDELTRLALDAGAFAGAVVRVERRGELFVERAWGLALDTPAEREALQPDGLFDIASLSKLYTTTAVLRLATLGRLDLEQRLADGLGWGASPLGELLGAANVRDALAHASGLPYWHPFYVRRGRPFLDILTELLTANPRRPGTVYSDLNFMLLGLLVEKAAGQPLAQAIDELVCRPLGLTSSAFGPLDTTPARAAAAGRQVAASEWGNRIEMGMLAELGLAFDGWRDTTRPIRGQADDGNCHYYFGGVAGHAGIFADARDLCALGRLYLEGGRLAGGAAWLDTGLAGEAAREQGGGRGLGFQLGENYPGDGFGHGGFTGTSLYLHAPSGLAAAILTNRLHVAAPRRIPEYLRAAAAWALGT